MLDLQVGWLVGLRWGGLGFGVEVGEVDGVEGVAIWGDLAQTHL